jgi:hypothetical protein
MLNPVALLPGILVCVLATTAAHADARTILFLKGVASSIASHCPHLPLDKELMRTTKRVPGTAAGTRADYAEGVKYIDGMLEAGQEDCKSVCGIRPGTCFFIIESPPQGRVASPEGAATAKDFIKYPAEMQGAWCLKEKFGGAEKYDRCGNGKKPSFQIIGNEVREAADLGCQLVAPLKLKPISRIASRAVATENCDVLTVKTDYTYYEGGHLSIKRSKVVE